VVTGPLASRRRSARAAAVCVARDAAALARTSWVAVIQAQNSPMTSRGVPERSTGPQVRSPAPAMVVLSSPERGLRRRPAGLVSAADLAGIHCMVVQQRGDQGAGLRYFLPVAAGQHRVVLGDRDRQPVARLAARRVQEAQPGPVGKPPARGERQGEVALGPGHHVPAGIEDRGDDLMAGEVAVEYHHPAGPRPPARPSPGR
jgi:hypothetical protein